MFSGLATGQPPPPPGGTYAVVDIETTHDIDYSYFWAGPEPGTENDGFYVYVNVDWAVPGTGYTIDAHYWDYGLEEWIELGQEWSPPGAGTGSRTFASNWIDGESYQAAMMSIVGQAVRVRLKDAAGVVSSDSTYVFFRDL
jgi:hypothetical protein